MITDCHIHIQPMEMFKPHALELMKRKRPNFDQIVEFCRSPRAFLKFLDASGIDRAMLINYVAPEVIGFTSGVNQFVADYVKEDPTRLLSCGSLHPRHTTNVLADVEQILRLGLKMIKIHPPHQLLFPNDYLSGAKELEIIYRAAEANGVPVMFHTGTSIFPGARNKYGDPIYVDDVAVDFPKLKILLAHGGRPLWMQTAFFLVRRHPNVYLDISGIPPKTLLKYFPRLEEIADKTLFGTDWPGPGVPDIKKNLDEFRALPPQRRRAAADSIEDRADYVAGLTSISASTARSCFRRGSAKAVRTYPVGISTGGTDRLATQRCSLFKIAWHVVYLNVERRVVVRFVAQRGNVTLNAAVCTCVDHRCGSHRLHLPAEKPGEEVGQSCRCRGIRFRSELRVGPWHAPLRKCRTS